MKFQTEMNMKSWKWLTRLIFVIKNYGRLHRISVARKEAYYTVADYPADALTEE